MTLEDKRMRLELVKVRAARAELEFKIEEKLDEIERIKQHIQAQVAREADLVAKIGE